MTGNYWYERSFLADEVRKKANGSGVPYGKAPFLVRDSHGWRRDQNKA